jgi:hypothetical protein
MPSPDREVPSVGPFLWEALTFGTPHSGGGGALSSLLLGGGGEDQLDTCIWGEVGGDMEEIGRPCIFRYFHPAYERTLGFHVQFQPKSAVGAENVHI